MSDEDKELLARIGQLAGQINRHKSQQTVAAPANHPTSYRRQFVAHPARHHGADLATGNVYRHASAPYPRAGYRGGRPLVAHRHRTLQLNTPKYQNERRDASDDATSGNSNWVSRTDRHRQLINADVYEKEAQNRTKAIEESRLRKLRNQRLGEKARFNAFLRRQATPSNLSVVPTNVGVGASRNEIMIDGMRFRVAESGKKLVKVMGTSNPGDEGRARAGQMLAGINKISDDIHSAPSTPKSATVAGVTFYRTKTGNLIANRVVQDHRYVSWYRVGTSLTAGSRAGVVKKTKEPCRIFSTTGSCPKGPMCRFQHDPAKVTMCRGFLKEGKCADGESCDLSHEPSPERVPNCVHFAKGNCAKPDCPYTHSQAAPGAPVCEAFGFCGYCEKGASCIERHVFECPDFSNTGSCKAKGCKLLHRERASVLRAHVARGEPEGDVSSDDGADHSDDVDSDDVAELLEAESEDSESDEKNKDFLPI